MPKGSVEICRKHYVIPKGVFNLMDIVTVHNIKYEWLENYTLWVNVSFFKLFSPVSTFHPQ